LALPVQVRASIINKPVGTAQTVQTVFTVCKAKPKIFRLNLTNSVVYQRTIFTLLRPPLADFGGCKVAKATLQKTCPFAGQVW